MFKKKTVTTLPGSILAGLILAASNAGAQDPKLPPSYEPTATCDLSQTEFNGWFATGTAAQNGIVLPANGQTFPPVENTACDFYKWGSQMFLWLTSPLNDAFVFDGPQFFDVIASSNPDYTYEFQGNSSGADNNQFLLRAGKPLDTESVAQAGGGGVLLTQAGDLTYYGIHANDVYAYYRTGQVAGDFTGTNLENNFPTTAMDVQTIEMALSQTFPDGIALSMELKTSWVPVSSVVDASKHVLIDATIPTYAQTSDTTWTQTGTQSTQLALVGFHVVGTVDGHPEMVWATFEHVDNAPDAAYDFQIQIPSFPTPIPVTIPVPYDSTGSWIYMKSGDPNPGEPLERASFVAGTPNTIVAKTGQTIGASDVARLNPWGSPPEGSLATPASEQNSAQLISLNTDIMTMLGALSDVRANYFQSGSIWTSDGSIPPSATDPNLRGSLYTANASMETFHQFTPQNQGANGSQNCFSCHEGTAGQGITTSHIFSEIAPLP